MESHSALIAVTAAALLCAPADAQRRREPPREWEVTLGAAVASRPSFGGSDRSIMRPLPFVAVRWRDTISLGEGGLTVYPGCKDHSSGKISESGDDRLKGLGTIRAVPGFRAFTSTRLSLFNFELSAVKFLNHGVTGSLGLSAPLPLGRKLILMPHVRATWADGQYMQTYFGVTPVQVGASIFPRFNAGSGFKDVQAGASLIWRINNHWFAGTDVGVTRLLADAALSPISLRDTNVTVMGMAGYRF